VRTWVNNGSLVKVERIDDAKRKNKWFVEVGKWVEK
jgi:hypothetical protein